MDECVSALLAFPPLPQGGDVDVIENDELYDKAVRAHLVRLNRLLKDQAATLAAQAHLMLQHVDPAVNSISYLALLQCVYNGDGDPAKIPNQMPECLLAFLLSFDARQIRYVGAALDRFLTGVANGVLLPSSVAVEALATAILKIDPTGSVFTTHHLGLVTLAYTAGNLEPALRVINKPAVFIPSNPAPPEPRYLCDRRLSPTAYVTRGTGLTGTIRSSTILQYDCLSAQIHCSRRDWARAFATLERAVTYPTRAETVGAVALGGGTGGAVSRLMAEAHNRWVLVGLLLHGRAPTVPSSLPNAVNKSFQTLGKPYLELARAFEARDARKLRAEAAGLTTFWRDEGTAGLVREVLAAFRRWQIVGLRDVYSKISLAEISRHTQRAEANNDDLGLEAKTDSKADAEPKTPTGKAEQAAEEAGQDNDEEDEQALEALLADMIASGMLRGKIERRSDTGLAYLTFLTEDEEDGHDSGHSAQASEARFAADMAAAARRIAELAPVVRTTSERITTSRDYIRHLVKEQKRERDPASRGGPGGSGRGLSQGQLFDSQVEDEDLMMGITAG